MKRRKDDEAANPGGTDIMPLLTRPKNVAIVALGRSVGSFVSEMIARGSRGQGPVFDEVWTLNRGLRAFEHQKLFCMDDMKWLQQKDKEYHNWLKKHQKPVITSTVYSGYDNHLAYPFQEVLEFIGDDIFAVNTVSYMVAYAMYTGVEHLSVYGADFFYPEGNRAESGGQAVAYLLGMAAGKGTMVHHVPQGSTMLYAHKIRVDQSGNVSRERYGYHRKGVIVKKKEGTN